jgi:hypothetical protein
MAYENSLIDHLVAKLNKQGFDPELCEDVPQRLRIVGPDEEDVCRWKILPVTNAPWVSLYESKLARPLPASFVSLIRRYIFLRFDLGPISMFANTGEDIYDELSIAAFRDPILSPNLLKAGLIHFARLPGDTNYDPICFETSRSAGDQEFPIVQVDHEAVLQKSKIRIVKQIAPSFVRLAEDFLRTGGQPFAN